MARRHGGSHEQGNGWHRADARRSRHRDGRSDALLLDPRADVVRTRARRRAGPPDAARREAHRVSRQRRPRRRDGPSLSASLRVALPRAQRGGGHSLHLSRLEVRRGGQLRRHAEPAAARLQGKGEGQGLQGRGARRCRVGLHGHARGSPAAARIRDPRYSGRRGEGDLHPARLQLPAGARGRDRHLAFRLPACRARRSGRSFRGQAGAQHRYQPRAGISSRRYRVGHAVRGLPRCRRRPDLLALRQLPVSVLVAGAEWRVRHAHACARLGAARRRAHHVRVPVVEEGGARGFAATARFQGRQADRRHRARQQTIAEHDRLARALAHGRQ